MDKITLACIIRNFNSVNQILLYTRNKYDDMLYIQITKKEYNYDKMLYNNLASVGFLRELVIRKYGWKNTI